MVIIEYLKKKFGNTVQLLGKANCPFEIRVLNLKSEHFIKQCDIPPAD